MYSSRHKYLARLFYTEKYIEKVLAKNLPVEDFKTDDTALSNNWDEGIIFAEIKGNYYKGYIIKINDPRRLFFVQAEMPEGNLLEQLAEKHEGIGGINASGYADPNKRGTVWGITINGGQRVSNLTRGDRHIIGGFNGEHKLIIGQFTEEEILSQNYIWAFEFGPLLIVNGEKIELTDFSGGIAPRTAIGQTAQGHILLVVIDGRQAGSIGATFKDLQTIFYANGAVNAINLDGGASSSMVYQGKIVNSPSDGNKERLLPNAILIK